MLLVRAQRLNLAWCMRLWAWELDALRRQNRMRTPIEDGTVYLVGAGPGDPELITVKGLRILRIADVVVYDRLVHPDLLEEARPDAERIYVGKAPGSHAGAQERINEILVEHARLGRVVVRLKGGDPFVFGRGGEEALALAAARIRFRVVPGISSSISVPAYAGIPVTHRNVSSAFTVVTGHSCRGGADPDWISLARAGTLVILMGLRRLPEIASTLIDAGVDASTPAAVVASGATNSQAVVEGTLESIGRRTRHLVAPATIVIGKVVALRPWLAWHDAPSKPGGDGAAFAAALNSGDASAFPGDGAPFEALPDSGALVVSSRGDGAPFAPCSNDERSAPADEIGLPSRAPYDDVELALTP